MELHLETHVSRVRKYKGVVPGRIRVAETMTSGQVTSLFCDANRLVFHLTDHLIATIMRLRGNLIPPMTFHIRHELC